MSYSVVILSKNIGNLVPCLRAIHEHEPAAPVLVLDDGIDWELCPIDLLPARMDGEKPFIFARNANIGIMAVGDDDVILLNDDALLKTAGGFGEMQRAAVDNHDFGLIGATCNNVGNRNQHPQGIGLREDPRMVCFICVYIPRRTIKAVGILDERFIGYGCEDDDYCLRVRKAGMKVGVFDGCFVDHSSLKSSFRGAADAGGDYRPNLERFKKKWGHDNFGNVI